MIEKDTIICFCNDINAQEVADFIKKNNIKTLDELLSQEIIEIGNKCEACREDGYEDSEHTLKNILSLIKQNKF